MKHIRYNPPYRGGCLVGNVLEANGAVLDVYNNDGILIAMTSSGEAWNLRAELAQAMIDDPELGPDHNGMDGLRETSDAMIAFWEKNHEKFGH